MHPSVKQFNALVDSGQITQDPWQQATTQAKIVATTRNLLVQEVRKLTASHSLNTAIETVLQRVNQGLMPVETTQTLTTLANKKGKLPGKSTVRNWCKAEQASGINGLLPKYTGTDRKSYGWEPLALELYHKPSKPAMAKVARDLREKHGYRNASEHNVRYFFSTLPAELQDKSPWRLGQKQYRDGQREFIIRTTENLPVGFLYQGDGHCVDQYIKHPKTGKIWRPELVVFMDIKTRYIVGWYVCIAEGSIYTMAALSNAMGNHNHVPAVVYIDNGSGFASRLMNDDMAGFYASFDIHPIFALPGNAKSKNVERFFRTLEDDFGKDWATYCGYDQSPDVSRHFSSDKLAKLEKAGKIRVPTLQEWMAKFEHWLTLYHQRPHPEYPNDTPQSLWNTLEPVEVVDVNLLVKPRARVSVIRSLITLHKRKYKADFLYQFNDQELIAEYDLQDDSYIRVFSLDGQWLTNATLKSKADYLPQSRIDEYAQKRLDGQKKRLENKLREKEQQAGNVIPMHTEQTQLLNAIELAADAQEQQEPANDEFDDVAAQMLNHNAIPESTDTDDKDAFDINDLFANP